VSYLWSGDYSRFFFYSVNDFIYVLTAVKWMKYTRSAV
jgi:hypothetical protein